MTLIFLCEEHFVERGSCYYAQFSGSKSSTPDTFWSGLDCSSGAVFQCCGEETDRAGGVFPFINNFHGSNRRLFGDKSIPEIAAHYTASFGILSGALDFQVSSAVVLGANIGSDVIQQTLIMAIVILMAGGAAIQALFPLEEHDPDDRYHCDVHHPGRGWHLFPSGWGPSFLAPSWPICITSTLMNASTTAKKTMALPRMVKGRKGVPENGKQALRDALISLIALGLTVGSAMIALKATEVVVAKTGVGGSLIGVITLGVASALTGIDHKPSPVCAMAMQAFPSGPW